MTTPNCTVTGLAIVMKPLVEGFGAEKAIVTTMQALSGAGFPGVPSLLVVDNILPYIKNEEEKVAKEAMKILGRTRTDGRTTVIEPREIPMGVSCNRVQVIDGHTETLYCEFPKAVEPSEVVRRLRELQGAASEAKTAHRSRAADHREEGERQTATQAGQNVRERPWHERGGGQGEERDRRRVPHADSALAQYDQGCGRQRNPYCGADAEGQDT